LSIEFSCSHCHKKFTASDDITGSRANCPWCNSFSLIPEQKQEINDCSFDSEEPIFEEDEFQLGEMVACPVCGKLMDLYIGTCQACVNEKTIRKFEDDSRDKDWKSGKVSVSTVFFRSSQLYRKNFGSCVSACFVCGFLAYFLTHTVFYFIGFILAGGVVGAVVSENPALVILSILLVPGGIALILFVSSLLFCYFLLGFQSYFLKVVQTQSLGVREIFKVGPYFWRMYLSSMVLTVFFLVGFAFYFIPGMILIFYCWPYALLIIDRDLPSISSITEAPKLIKGNMKSLAIILLPIMCLAFAGMQSTQIIFDFCEQVLYLTADQSDYLTFGVTGIIGTFAISFGMLILAVTYAEMTGQ